MGRKKNEQKRSADILVRISEERNILANTHYSKYSLVMRLETSSTILKHTNPTYGELKESR
jgi:hypothetical protein